MPQVIGLDFGSDSCRAVLVDCASGACLATAVHAYPRWARGEYCDPQAQRFRQHPLDYIEALEAVVAGVLAAMPKAEMVGIGIDTTGSTPAAMDAQGRVLALRPEFADEPAAMFVLWKDHTALAEAERINALAHGGKFVDHTRFCGGSYSPEWFWAKAARVLAANEGVAAACHCFVEHGDWMPALLAGISDPALIKRSRCIAGHKAMWHPSWGGFPAEDFLRAVEPRLAGMRERMQPETFTSDQVAGRLCAEWAGRLALPAGIPIAVGALDAHMGAVGANVKPGMWCKVVGTSTCDMVVSSYAALGDRVIPGICGQVDGSIIPGAIGLEAGQAAFGDVYAWFTRLLLWPIEMLGGDPASAGRLLAKLDQAAAALPPGGEGLCSLDWHNGRRTPDLDAHLGAAISGIRLGSDAPRLYRALVEATAFGSRAIQERMRAHGVSVDRIIALGGIARKSPFVMQCLADVLGCEIAVSASDQTCALGAAMCAAVVAGCCADLGAAGDRFDAGLSASYRPDPSRRAAYDAAYAHYQALGAFVEGR
jgi:L-ribulokinase